MDSFLSETLSSDPSTPGDVENKAPKSKLRKTEDLISTSLLDSPGEDYPENTIALQPVTSFLPKIDLSENTVPSLKKRKDKSDLLKKKQKEFELGRSAVEMKTFAVSKLTKFPKIKLVLKNKKATKHKEVKKRRNIKKDSNLSKKKLKSYDGKENADSRSSSSKSKKRSKKSNMSSFTDLVSPCTVVLERLPLELIRSFLRKSNSSTSLYDNLVLPCKVMLEKLSPEIVRSFSKSDTSTLEIDNCNNIKRKAVSLNMRRKSTNNCQTKKLQRSLAVDEEMTFSPKDSSSPMYKTDKSELLGGRKDKNATFEIINTYNVDDTEHKTVKLDVSGIAVLSSSSKNLTYELNNSQDVLNENNTTYEITACCTTPKPGDLCESSPSSATGRGSTFTKEGCVTPMPLLKKSEVAREIQEDVVTPSHVPLEDESPPWDQDKENNSPSQTSSTYTRSLNEIPRQDSAPVEDPDSEKSVSSAETSGSSEANLDVNQNREPDGSIIEISDGDGSCNTSAEFAGKEVEKTQVTLKSSMKRTSISVTQVTRPKSVIRTKDSVSKNRKVTFSDMSIIIVDDDSDSEDSPRKFGTPVPTNFPPDSDNEDVPFYDEKTERTPLRAYVKLTRTSFPESEEEGCFQSARMTSTSSPNKSVNRRTLAGCTPLRLNERKLNKRLSPSEKVTGSIPKKTRSIKKTKMPDFAKLHKKMYDNMPNLEEYSARKAERAKMLLSGQKPHASGSKASPKKVSPRSRATLKKQLDYENRKVKPPPTSAAVKNLKAGCTRYGFKVTENCGKKEQLEAVANRTRPQKKDSNFEIKGVRSNRRFELLMKMRKKC